MHRKTFTVLVRDNKEVNFPQDFYKQLVDNQESLSEESARKNIAAAIRKDKHAYGSHWRKVEYRITLDNILVDKILNSEDKVIDAY